MCPTLFRYCREHGGFENSSYEIGKLPRFNGLWKSLVIMRKVKANYSKGVFIPQERLDLEEGKEVVVSVGKSRPKTALSSRSRRQPVAGSECTIRSNSSG